MYMTGITQKCPVGNICHVSLNTKDRKTIKEFCLVCYLNFGFEVFRLLPPLYTTAETSHHTLCTELVL